MKWQFNFLLVAFLVISVPSFVRCHDDDDSVDYSDVLTLTTDNFDESIEKYNHTLVVFYAPWCGHCKNLMPHFAEAATKLKENAGVALAKVDTTVETEIGTRFEVKGFPTIKLFRKDGTSMDYTGGRTAETIISWIEGMMGPALEILETDTKPEGKGIHFVGRIKKSGSKAFKLLEKAADKRRLTAKFTAVIGDSHKDEISVYRPDEEPVTTAIGTSLEKLEEWLDMEKFPIFGAIDGETYAAYEERGLEMVWFAGTKDDYEKHGSELRTAAAKFRNEYSFVWVDNERFGSYIEGGLGITKLPGVVLRMKEGGRYKYPEDKKMVAKEIMKFLEDVKAGKIEKFLKSEPIPETNDEPVKVVVGKNFDEIMFHKDKDVMLEVYAPWCGHCKRLEPIYNDLAEKLQPYKHVVIAKMDGTANEPPNNDFQFRGFPSLFFVKAGADKPETYSGDRTLEAIVKYIKEKSSKPIDLEVEPEPEPEAKETEEKDEL